MTAASKGALLDAHGLAERLNVPFTWVRDKITARAIPITWIGRHARFTEADVDALLAIGQSTTPPGTPPPSYPPQTPPPPAGPVNPPKAQGRGPR